MKKQNVLPLAIIAALALVMATTVFAQSSSNTATTIPSPGNPLVAKGIAISTTGNTFDPVGLGVPGDTTLTGKLVFEQQKYDITAISIASDGSVSATLQQNSVSVGSISLAPASQASHWTGSMTISGQTYNLYLVSAPFGMGEHMEQMGQNLINSGKWLEHRGHMMENEASETSTSTTA
jgi:hypothetical protein